jgi:hypothetical protein
MRTRYEQPEAHKYGAMVVNSCLARCEGLDPYVRLHIDRPTTEDRLAGQPGTDFGGGWEELPAGRSVNWTSSSEIDLLSRRAALCIYKV